jgi:heavy metal translocating P-type ATPase
MNSAKAGTESRACLHCGLPALAGSSFCCAGCGSVYALLMERGLGHFYDLQKEHSFRPPAPVREATSAALSEEGPASRASARFHLEGIHCLGCLWLLEKLPEIEPRILSARLDMAHDILEITVRPGALPWEEVARWISRLGYRARALAEGEDSGEARRRAQGSQLTRIGIAAFATGNIMLLSVSIYAGADPMWAKNFAWLSAVLAAPVLTYCAWPLYQAAFAPLLRGRLSIDLAIVLALLAGIAASASSLAGGSAEGVYFDSLSMLVFLLLSSRYFLSRMRESLASAAPCLSFQENERFDRVHPSPGRVKAAELEKGDQLLLQPGQVLPVDSTLLEDDGFHFDLSLLTGESLPVKFSAQERVEAGSRVEGRPARFRVLARATDSRLAAILGQIRAYELHKSPVLDFADRMGRRFVLVVLSICAGLLLWNPGGEGVARALALAIVTCPCVLAFAIPLALTRALQRAAGRGILFRDSSKLEALAGASHLFLDKTGTLTSGIFAVKEWKRVKGSLAEAKAAAAELERHSPHPIARAILRDSSQSPNGEQAKAMPAATQVSETHGHGISGRIAGHRWEVCRSAIPSAPGENRVDILCDNELRAELVLGDSVRPEAAPVIAELKRLGFSPHLLSGDSPLNTGALAARLDLASWQGGLNPEAKAEIVSGCRGTVMVGDGANDAVAFRAADVSVAMQGAVELSLRHSDLLLTRPGLGSLLEAVRLSRSTMQLVRMCFTLTLAYNILAGTLAVAGLMQPLFAALLMPLSALTVFSFITWRTSSFAKPALPAARAVRALARRSTA